MTIRATKAARLIALYEAIEAGVFDPATVNMSELARLFSVDRATILRDLDAVPDVFMRVGAMRAKLRNADLGESTEHNRRR